MQETPLQKGMAASPVLLPGGSHGQRSLVDHSPQGPKESDVTEPLSTHAQANLVVICYTAVHS